LNADLLAAGLSPFSPETAALAAGRVLLKRMKELIRDRRDFGFETTLAGKTYRPVWEHRKQRGYALHLFYLWLPSVDMAVARVAQRVRQGGHNVPEPTIHRRFDVGLRNLFDVYLPLCESWQLFDNSTIEPRVVAHYKGGELAIVDAAPYSRIIHSVQGRRP
jgi:predicted ABC-type ATPase